MGIAGMYASFGCQRRPPRSDQSRSSAWLILKWLSELYVERVIIENVPEFLSWGPLDHTGRPIKSKKGEIFKIFIAALQSLNFTVEYRILTCADYGDPTTRRRLFIQGVRGRKRIIWPEITHMDGAENLMGYQSWVPARDIIDWSIPGTSIFDRKKPLAEATIKRIEKGIEKYCGGFAKPFLAILRGASKVRSIAEPLPTVTSGGGHYGLVEPFLLPNEGYYRGNPPRSVDLPLSAITASRGFGSIVQPFVLEYYGNGMAKSVNKPLGTVTTKDRFATVEPFLFSIGQNSAKDRSRSIHEPISTIVCKAEHCLVEPNSRLFDIRFRMLKNHELKRAQGFPDDYILTGNTTEQTKLIGNAVPVNTAKALAASVMMSA